MKTKFFTLFLALIVSEGMMFAKVQIDDLYYNLDAANQTAEVTFYENNLSDGQFNTGWNIDTVNIPSVVTYDGTAYNVTRIGKDAFAHCFELTTVTIPNSVTSIGITAFFASSKLSSVTIEALIPPTVELEYQDGKIYNIFHYSGCDYNQDGKIFVPCGSLEAYQTADGWSEYASIIKYMPTTFPFVKNVNKGRISIPENLSICDDTVEVTAIPDRGCYFISWSDGNTDNPRIINVAQYETLNANIDYLLADKCGKDSALTWIFDTTKMALTITGQGALSENYTYGKFIESLTIGNEVTQIGKDAFYRFEQLKNIILGSSVKVLGSEAFSKCYAIETITCYSQRPPTVQDEALDGVDYSTIVYVPAEYLETYKMHDAWGLYDVRPLGAIPVETNDVQVEPAETTATVAWPAVSGAATYELVVKDKSGNVICTLIFNANGQLTQIAFGAPAREQSAGFSFTVIGLEEGKSYDLTITAKNDSGATLDEKSVSFTTSGSPTEGFNQIPNNQLPTTHKVFRNGQILILRGDRTYTLTGQEVK